MRNKFLVTVLLTLLTFSAKAYSFLAVNSEGKTVYYSILSSSSKTVRVTFDGAAYTTTDEYEGRILLESTVLNEATGDYYIVTGIATNAFNASSVQEVEIAKSITNIAATAFKNCSLLEKVIIHGSGVTIAGNAFQNCSSLDTIVCTSFTPPSLSSNSLNGVPAGLIVVVPCGAKEIYEANVRWGAYTIIEMDMTEPQEFSAAIFEGESFQYNGQSYTTEGSYPITRTTENGCTINEILHLIVNQGSGQTSCQMHMVPSNDTVINSFATIAMPLGTDTIADFYRWYVDGGEISSTSDRNVIAYVTPNHSATYIVEGIYEGDGPNLIYNGHFEFGYEGFESDYEQYDFTIANQVNTFHLGQYSLINSTMQVNGEYLDCAPSQFLTANIEPYRGDAIYRTTVKNVKPLGDYIISFDMINLETLASKNPNLGVYVNGIYKGNAKPANNGCNWEHFDFVFRLDDSDEAVIELKDSTIASHVTFLDNVSLREMCVARDTINITVNFDNEHCDVAILPGDTTIISFSSQPLNVQLSTDHEATYYIWNSDQNNLSSTTDANPTITLISGTTSEVTLEVVYESEINLIPNGDFEQGNTGFTSSYTYASTASEYLSGNRWGKYMITDTPKSFENAWTNCTNATGLYLIGDGSTIPNVDFYTVTVDNLQQNTDYALSFDVTQLITTSGDNAILQFKVNGVVVGTPDTLQPVTCQWKHYYTIINTGNNTSLTISLTDLSTVSNNNDFALDNVCLKQICRAYDTIHMTYLHDNYCEVNIVPNVSDTLIFAAGDQTINLSIDRIADYYSWIGEGLTVTDQQSTTATIPFGETRQYIVEAMTEGDDNLIPNGDFEQGNTGFTSQLTYTTATYPDLPEGYYTVGTNPRTYHTGFINHTHDGKMIIANGSNGYNTYVFNSQINVEPNKRYVVTFEATNASFVTAENTLSKFQFSINDVQLGPVLTIGPTGGEWSNFYQIWESGDNTTAVIKILNQNTLGNGNDFCLDNICFRELCVARDTITITSNYYQYDTVTATFCEGTVYNDGVVITIEPGEYTDTISDPTRDIVRTLYLEMLPRLYDTINPVICDNEVFSFNNRNYTLAGQYNDTLTSELTGCDSIITINLTVYPTYKDTVFAHICEGEEYTEFGFSATETGLYTQELSSIDGCDSLSSLVLVVREQFLDTLDYQIYVGDTFCYYGFNETETGQYSVTFQNQYGCDSTYILNLSVIELFFPNLVSPNGDGINDVFEIVNLLGQSIFEHTELLIYNRYGKRIYFKENISSYDEFWDPDATNTPTGTYFYRFKAKGFQKVMDFNGTIEVMR